MIINDTEYEEAPLQNEGGLKHICTGCAFIDDAKSCEGTSELSVPAFGRDCLYTDVIYVEATKT